MTKTKLINCRGGINFQNRPSSGPLQQVQMLHFVIFTMNPRHTIASQLLENANDYIIYCLASQKGMTDEKRKLFGFVLNILITGNNIDWKIPNSVGHVCDILGVGRSTVFENRKASSIDYKPPKRKRRSDALEEQLWWPHASCRDGYFLGNELRRKPKFMQMIQLKSMTSPSRKSAIRSPT